MWHCLLLDLKDDAALIEAYRQWHRPGAVPATVVAAIRASGVEAMEIYQRGDRLVMMMKTGPRFDPTAKAAADAADPEIVAWEQLMSTMQQPLPGAAATDKWLPAERIFALAEQPLPGDA
jgi:L-rhamnose mutarotase